MKLLDPVVLGPRTARNRIVFGPHETNLARGRGGLGRSLEEVPLMNTSPGIYVEIAIKNQVDHIWHLTQDPTLHQRWDLR